MVRARPGEAEREATAALESCTAAAETIRISAFSLIELVYAAERARNPFSEQDRRDMLGVLGAEDSPFEVVPVTAAVANRVAAVPRAANADPGDRIVVATAEVLGLSIVSADVRF
ncbi:MAG: PIN domain-containing protein, partial [Trebonia sp.]